MKIRIFKDVIFDWPEPCGLPCYPQKSLPMCAVILVKTSQELHSDYLPKSQTSNASPITNYNRGHADSSARVPEKTGGVRTYGRFLCCGALTLIQSPKADTEESSAD